MVGAGLIVMGGFAASKVLGLLRNAVIGYQYGASREYEMFVAALAVPDLLFQVVAGGAVASAFIPVFNTYLARDDRSGAWRLVSAFANLGMLVLGVGAALLAIAAPLVVGVLVPGWSAEEQARTVNLIQIMAVSPAIFAVSTLATSTLNAENRFALAAAAPLAYNLAIAAGAVLLRPWGAEGLALSAVVGALLHLLVQVPGLIVIGLRYRLTLGLRLSGTREVLQLMGPRVIGLGITQLNLLVAIALASFLAQGSIAYLGYAWLVITVPLGVAAMGMSTAVFPELARQVATGDLAEARRAFHFGLGLVLGVALLAAVALIVLAQPVVALLLERGEFGRAATMGTAFAVALYAIGLPGHATTEMVSRAFYAIRDTVTPVRIAALGAAVNISLSLVLMRTELSYGGIAIGNAVGALIEAAVLGVFLHRRLGWLGRRELRAFARPAGLATLAFGAGCLGGRMAIERYVDLAQWAGQLVVVGASSALGFILAAALLAALSTQPGRMPSVTSMKHFFSPFQ